MGRFCFLIRARFRRLQTDTDVFLPILAQNDFMNARKRKFQCFFQSVQRHPTSFTISQDFSQPSPPPKCPSRSEISGSGLIFPKYWVQVKTNLILMPKPDFARITNKDPVRNKIKLPPRGLGVFKNVPQARGSVLAWYKPSVSHAGPIRA